MQLDLASIAVGMPGDLAEGAKISGGFFVYTPNCSFSDADRFRHPLSGSLSLPSDVCKCIWDAGELDLKH